MKRPRSQKRGRPPHLWDDVKVELEYIPGNDSEEDLLQALEIIFSEPPFRKKRPIKYPEDLRFIQGSLF
jgi:hypothetical protein